MSDFFYYGQKDTIQRLNELAGRGAVVASYAPKVGMSPVGGPNGYINPAWLDPDKSVASNLPLSSGGAAKFGYNYLQTPGVGQRLFKLAMLPASSPVTYASLRIDAVIGGWGSASLTPMTIVIGSRDGLTVEWSSTRIIPTSVRFLTYTEVDGSISVYLFFLSEVFAQAAFNLMGNQATTYTSPVPTSSVTGTLSWDSSAAEGTSVYIAPRVTSLSVGGRNTGTSFNEGIAIRGPVNSNTSPPSYIYGSLMPDSLPAGQAHEMMRLAVSSMVGTSYSGHWSIMSSEGTGSAFKDGFKLIVRARDTGSGTYTDDLLRVSGNGQVYMPLLKAGSSDATATRHVINRVSAQAEELLFIGREGISVPCVAIRASDGNGGWNGAASVMHIGKNSTTNRAIASPGTFNAQGTDYAEYMGKSALCPNILAGQIVGITNRNEITDKWADAVMFATKSTDPSFVGGDSWATDVGHRPDAQAGMEPAMPLRREDVIGQVVVPETNPSEYTEGVTEAGDTDEEWDTKMAAYLQALADWNNAVLKDRTAVEAFDAKLEAARQRVDRIAIAGRVPVNVLGAQPGDYIVPVQDGAGIQGIAVHKDDITMKQYLHAVGRVISIEPDGRAYVMVKAV
ncbi:hypothetical protein [Janthinobacterium lividum]|uniref:hypothetical protein n=1 Tax=Janthinobacterium lividum TaxID=29581 RepID=UPI0008934FB6|nr:hypothetical protein [Janthinobacterium lividum]MCC7712221.1 hypothetical protein [Janthinobacterium lividum]OEZ54957.1 hypothetical protein JANLI_35220 [Janthinobacterium lividum]WQE27102.1 hypothetical protein U0004_19090 [Janthinobacterium lividum]STQ97988.1 Uncharacterised protein [Janthinobacterium lividum]